MVMSFKEPSARFQALAQPYQTILLSGPEIASNSFLFPNHGIEDRSLSSNSLDCCCCVIKFAPSRFLPEKNLPTKKGLVLKFYPPPPPQNHSPPLGRNKQSVPYMLKNLVRLPARDLPTVSKSPQTLSIY